MHIAIISDRGPVLDLVGPDTNGQNVMIAESARWLSLLGHQVTIYQRREDPSLPARATSGTGVEVVQLEAGPPEPLAPHHLVRHLGELSRTLRAHLTASPVEIVHSHGWFAGVAAIQAIDGPSTGTLAPALVQSLHGLGAVERRHRGSSMPALLHRIPAEAVCLRRADLLAVSSLDEQLEIQGLGVPEARIVIIPGMVDTTVFTPRGPAAPRSRRARIALLGPLRPHKGVDVAIQALRDVADAELLVIGAPSTSERGTDDEVARLRAIASRHRVTDRVRFIGPRPHAGLPWLLRSADLLANLPTHGTRGLAALEGMACGLSVVGTSVGGMLETISHGRTGLLVRPHNVDDVVGAVHSLLSDDRRRRRMGAEAAFATRERYDGGRAAAELQGGYEAVLATRRQAAIAS